MPSGRLTALEIPAGVNTLIYTAPGGMSRTVTINICNRNDADVAIRLALLDRGIDTLANEDWLEYGTIIRANGMLEREGITMSQEQTLVGYSDTSNVSVSVWS